MSVFMQPIYTQTIGAGGAGAITFSNIPQGFTDLKIVVSARSLLSGYDNLMLRFNGDTTVSNYSTTSIYGDGTSTVSERVLNFYTLSYAAGSLPNANSTANTFGSLEAYIPNYNSGNFKQIITENVAENNAASLYVRDTPGASLYRSTSPITSISIFAFGNMAQHTTATLYGISNVYDTAAPTAPTLGTITDEAGFFSVAFTPAANDQADSYWAYSPASPASPIYGAGSPISIPVESQYNYNASIWVAAVNSLGVSPSATISSGNVTSNNYTSIATGTISTTTSFIDFTNIPQNYKHLQLRCRVRGGSGASTTDYFLVQIMPFTSNSDYFTHALESVGDVVRGSVYQPTNTFSTSLMSSNGADANNFTSVIIDFYDYAKTTVFKRAQMFSGWSMPNTTGGQNNGNITLSGGILPQFLPISNIRLCAYVNLTVGSTFSLYGVS